MVLWKQILSLLLASSVALFAALLSEGVHWIKEGHVGVYWRGGALLDEVSQPGYHLLIPYMMSYASIQTTMRTQIVENIPCGTSGGVMIDFKKIEIVFRLQHHYVVETVRNYTANFADIWLHDNTHHQVNEFCSTRTLQEVFMCALCCLYQSHKRNL